MDRAVRFSLFALGIFVGSLLVVVTSRSMDDEAEVEVELELRGEEVAQSPTESPEELDPAEIEIRGRERAERRVAAFLDAISREPVDPDWGPAQEQQIAESFAAEAPAGFKLLSTTCKTSLCIAEIETPSKKASRREMGWHRFLGFSKAHIHHHADEGGAHRTDVFIARAGHSLPRAIEQREEEE
jgi:hypothetical protein